jgi:S-DNA-T family DNA segregation ATPase FtsK/SpoIIIE
MFEDAVRLVLEFGKASTSLLQRRLRIGYGRAAHLIDLMERDGIVGPADGPKPREILKPPDWLREIEPALR